MSQNKQSRGRGTTRRSGHQEKSEPKYMILWQNDIKVSLEKKDTFIQHVVDKYYSVFFKDYNSAEVKEWVVSLIENNKENDSLGEITVSLPLIASCEEKDGFEEYKFSRKVSYYYKPIPPMEEFDDDENPVDQVFSKGDKIMDSLLSQEETQYERKDLDAARDDEKKAYSDLFKENRELRTQKSNANNEEVVRLNRNLKTANDKIKQKQDQLDDLNEKLSKADEEKRQALKKCDDQWKSRLDALDVKFNQVQKLSDEYKQKWTEEERKRIGHEKTIASRDLTIVECNQTIQRLNEESRLYTERVVFFLSAQNFAKRVVVFFEELDQLLADANQLKVKMPSTVSNADDYNYYLLRIEKKFYSAIAKVSNLFVWRQELQMLAQTGVVPTLGLINSKIGNGKVKENQWESTLRMLVYQGVMCHLAGAAVVMGDELALMLPKMVKGVDNTQQFVKIVEKLRAAIKDMGYDLNYVKPFTPLDAYKNVQNVEFTKADVPQGIIFEIYKMSLNFGSTKSDTEVSAK